MLRLVFAAIYIFSSLVIVKLLFEIVRTLLEGFVLAKYLPDQRTSTADMNDPMSEGHDLATTSEKRCAHGLHRAHATRTPCARHAHTHAMRTPCARHAHTTHQHTPCTCHRCGPLLDYLAQMSVGWVMLALFWLCFCPIFYFRVFLPCWDCFDFESTMAHEIGHVLGFNHPNTFSGANLVATGDGVMGPDVCMDPLRHVQLMPLPEGADSIMFSVLKHRDRTCLSADDVQARRRGSIRETLSRETPSCNTLTTVHPCTLFLNRTCAYAIQGLHFLYPMCEGADPEPQCLKERRTSGYLRLLITVALPYFLMSLLLFLVISAVRCHQRRQLQEPYIHMYICMMNTYM